MGNSWGHMRVNWGKKGRGDQRERREGEFGKEQPISAKPKKSPQHKRIQWAPIQGSPHQHSIKKKKNQSKKKEEIALPKKPTTPPQPTPKKKKQTHQKILRIDLKEGKHGGGKRKNRHRKLTALGLFCQEQKTLQLTTANKKFVKGGFEGETGKKKDSALGGGKIKEQKRKKESTDRGEKGKPYVRGRPHACTLTAGWFKHSKQKKRFRRNNTRKERGIKFKGETNQKGGKKGLGAIERPKSVDCKGVRGKWHPWAWDK